MNNKIDQLKKAAGWFVTEKAPKIKQIMDEAIFNIENSISLDLPQKKALGLGLFCFAMEHGPTTFKDVENISMQFGLDIEFLSYAQNWIDSAKANLNENS